MTSFLLTPVIVSSLLGASVEPLDGWLEHTARRVERFWQQFSSVASTESVTQLKLEPKGKVIDQRHATYDYLVLLTLLGDEVSVEESRIQQGKVEKPARRPLLVTGGFSTLLLIFHPQYQAGYEFRRMPDEETGGRRLERVAFTHTAGRSPSALQLRGHDYPIEWQGVAWIDPSSGRIVRIRADLKKPMDDVGLKRLTADTAYMQVRFAGDAEDYWLPLSAVIEAETEHQRWRNVHQFANYKRFGVDTQVTTQAPR